MAIKNQDTIFTELRDKLNLVRESLEKEENIYSQKNLYALQRVDSFIRSGAWSRAKSVKNLLLYIDMSSTEASEKTGQAKTTIRSQRANASKLIKHLLGSDCVESCLSSDRQRINAVLNRIEILLILNKPVSNYISNEIIERFINVKHKKSYDLDECEKEIKVLAEMSAIHKERILGEVDARKMAYLVSVLLQPKEVGDNKEPNIELASLFQMIEYEEQQITELSIQNERQKQVIELYEENDKPNGVSDNSFAESDFSDEDLEDDSFFAGGTE